MRGLPIILLAILGTSQSLAHPPEFDSEGTSTILGNGSSNRTVYGDNYGGYGYLASSEAEAHHQLQMSCDSGAQRKYLSAYCRGRNIDPNRPVNELISDTMRSVVLYRLRTHATEYLGLNIKAAAAALGEKVELERPECVSEDSPLWIRTNKKGYKGKSKMAAKAEAIASTLRGDNMARALLYGERLEAGGQQNNCESTVGGQASACTSIQHTSYRLRTSFPALFRFAVQGNGHGQSSLVHKADHYDEFRTSLATLMGAHNAGDITEEEATVRGLAYLEDGTKSGPYRVLEDRFNAALSSAADEPARSLLGKAYLKYKRSIRRLEREHLRRMTQELAGLCKNKLTIFGLGNRERVNIYHMALQYPNIVRQTILDMSPSERGLTQAVLCDAGAMPMMQRAPQCNGVSGGPLPDNDVNVGRWKINDWPNGSQNFFRLSKPKAPPAAPITIKLNVNFTLGPSLSGLPDGNSNGIPDQLECQLRLWQADVNAWANCSVGAVASANINTSNQSLCPSPVTPSNQTQRCPLNGDMATLNPKVNFQINMTPTNEDPPPRPHVQLHRCYRLDIPGNQTDRGNCEKVKEVHVNKCISDHPDMLVNCILRPQPEAKCRAKVMEFCRLDVEKRFLENPDSLNRADSSNYTLNESFSVVRHEIFHQMGLADEYYSDERPYSQLGEHNSIMRSSRSLNSRLYPRHLSQILDVLRCPDVSNELTE